MSKRTTFSVMVFLKKRNTIQKRRSIYVRITVNGSSVELATQLSLEKEKWDNKLKRSRGRLDKDYEINRSLMLFETRVQTVRNELEARGEMITAIKVKNELLGNTEKEPSLMDLFKEHNQRQIDLISTNQCTPGTAERYKTSIMHVKMYLHIYKGVKDIEFKELDYQFILGFEKYLKVERSCCHNTTMKYITNLKKIVNIAIAQRIINYDPFIAFKIKLEKVDRGYLTQNELDIIMNQKFSIERIQQVKDVFIFCCYTGLVYADVKRLSTFNIIIDDNGIKWIKIARKKTKSICKIPLLPIASEILEKYKSHPFLDSNKLLPVISNQKMNSYLKEIGDICGITKNLSSGLARHSFATTVTLANKIPLETVSKMLGHSNISTTQIYARITDSKIINDMEKLL